MKRLLCLPLLVFAFGCSGSDDSAAGGRNPSQWDRLHAEQDATRFAEEGVRKQLKDPSSAEFRNETAYSQPNGAVIVCGEVNAKNGFGGRNGFEGFVGAGDAVFLRSAIGARAFRSLVVKSCRTNVRAPN